LIYTTQKAKKTAFARGKSSFRLAASAAYSGR
jgi:hypothetical protein